MGKEEEMGRRMRMMEIRMDRKKGKEKKKCDSEEVRIESERVEEATGKI